MKIDRAKLKKATTEVPADCRALIDKIKSCHRNELVTQLKQVKSWSFGKCELYHWADVLDIFDDILDAACNREGATDGASGEHHWALSCDLEGNETDKELLLQVLQFTALLIEHSFTRHLYSSMEHLTTLLASSDMTTVLAVLNLLYVFSKRSNFITRLNAEKKQGLVMALTHLAESWGGKENGFGLAECCQDLSMNNYPPSATTLHFDFYTEVKEEKGKGKHTACVLTSIHVQNVDKIPKLPAFIMDELMQTYKIPESKQMLLFTHIRLAHSFSNYEKRLQCVQARLQAISILVYSNAIQENVNTLLYSGFTEELVDILELKTDKLMEIKAASLRTLTSVIHLERNPKLSNIIDATGAAHYHGFLPVLVRTCMQHMIDPDLPPFPQPFATALFSFLYHLASYESGGEALVSCGMMEALLKIVNWYGEGQEHITFVTRAVRVVDLITNLDMQAFQAHGGLSTFINRLEHEVDICRKEQPFVIRPPRSDSTSTMDVQPSSPSNPTTSPPSPPASASPSHTSELTMEMEGSLTGVNQGASTSVGLPIYLDAPAKGPNGKPLQCFPQRAALLKSMLNFLKKAIPDPTFSESIRHLMDASLPRSLKHIISNADYYGPSLFLLATDVVTVYVFQEPSLLSSLQDKGLTDVVLQALLVKDVPATREVLASLPNMFSALCLNARGLEALILCKPFERLFKVLLSPDYLPAMRRRRSSDPPGDTASNLGSAMDELMRHQPSLRTETTKAIIKLLEELCSMGRDPRYICQKPQPKAEQVAAAGGQSRMGDQAAVSDDDDEDEEEVASMHSGVTAKPVELSQSSEQGSSNSSQERRPIPLMDYVLNVMKFVEAILSNNTTDDHCREFVTQKGLTPLMGILGLPNLPVDFPTSPSCQAVALVCKAILTLSHEPQVLKQGLLHLNEVLQSLEPLHRFLNPPGGSVLLHELAGVQGLAEPMLSAQAMPLLHSLSSAHAYITMFTHVCRVGQSDVRSISVSHWGSDLGLLVLQGLSKLYTSLVWESTVLLAFCSEDILPADCDFGKADLEKLLPKDGKSASTSSSLSLITKLPRPGSIETLKRSSGDVGSNGVSAAMQSLTTSENSVMAMEVEDQVPSGETSLSELSTVLAAKKSKLSPAMQAQIKQIKPLLSASSRLGRALAELFGLLVKLCVGSPVRQRRSQLPQNPVAPTVAARAVATALTKLLANGLSWTPPEYSPVPKLRLTFFICSVGFTSPMLFDEKKFPYHLMLQKFLLSGGQDSLFEAFRWAISCGGKVPFDDGLEHPSLPDGTGEFLDAWLMLLEKMVNTKNVLESPHTLPAKSTQPGFVPFSSLQYIIHTHKMAFTAIMYLWDKKPLKVYGNRMSESILAILCHIIKGEAVIKELLAKERVEEGKAKDSTSSTSAGPSTGAAVAAAASSSGLSGAIVGTIMSNIHARVNRLSEPELNQEHLQQLMDMGFSREHCSDALRNSASLEQATDWLLTHPPSLTRPSAFPRQPGASETKVEEAKKTEEEEDTEREEQIPEEPLEKPVLDNFTDVMLPGALRLLDELPETVYRVCDLIIVVTNRNGDKWRNNMLVCLVNEIAELCLRLMEAATPLTTSDTMSVSDWANKLSTLPETNKLTVRLHLLSLMFEEMQLPCAETVEDSGILDLLVRLLDSTQRCLSVAVTMRPVSTPKWATPLLLLLDLYEKVAVISKHKADLKDVVGDSHVWKWFDDRSGKWCNYGSSNNKAIDDAYRAGEPSVRFTAGRRRYTVQFGSMIQVNEETANRRPIMLALPTKEERETKEAVVKEAENTDTKKTASGEEKSIDNQMEVGEDAKEDSTSADKKRVVNGLMPDQIASIVRSGVALIAIPVNPDTLHALMRLLLRLTREYQYAAQFATLGGTKYLLQLKQSSGFQGFTSLATLLFRHVLEEPNTLRHTLEKVIRSATARSGPGLNGITQGGGSGLKEMHYVLRVLTPAACRAPALFSDITRSILRIQLPPPAKRDEDEARLALPNMPQNLKCVSSKQVSVPPMEPHVHEVLCDLLNALTVVMVTKEELSTATAAQSLEDAISQMTRSISDEQPMVRRQGSAADLQQTAEVSPVPFVDDPAPGGSSSTTITPVGDPGKGKEGKGKEDEDKKQQSLLPKSGVLRLLAELIKSYAGCALLVTQHTYTAEQSPLITEDCSVLAYVLDNLLPPCQESGDKDCPALARVVITSVAACNHSPEAQMTLVAEIKSALQRALVLPESTEKHSKVQALTSIISTMIEACPTPGQLPNEVFKGQQNLMNNIVRILLKRGIVTDLARVPHSLDMSSPSMSATINAALKPLETLCRIVNQPQTVSARAAKGKAAPTATAEDEDGGAEATVVEPPATTAEAVPAGQLGDPNTTQADQELEPEATQDTIIDPGDVTIEDVTGNDEATSGLEETMPLEAVEPSHHNNEEEHELEAALEQLLQQAGNQHATDEVLGEIIMETVDASRGLEQQGEEGGVVIDVEVETEDMDPHDSQMITQEISEDEEDNVSQEHEENDSEGEEEDEDHEVGDEDDEEEDEDEDEDDEEGSDMEADEDDFDFDDIDDDDMPFGMNDDDIEAQLQEMLQTTVAGTQIRSYQLPISIHDTDNTSEMLGPMVPPAPSNVTATHPLLIRQSDSHNVGGAIAARVHRAGRQRGTYRYTGAPGRQTLHVHYTGEQPMPPTPAILQRLLGPSAANVLQLTNTLFSGAQPRFHFIMNDDVHFLSRNDDNLFEDLFLDSFFEAEGSNSGMLSNVPAALSRWTEEARVLDADSMHDCITVLKPAIIDELEQHRDKELSERREKRRKLATEEQARKDKKNGSVSEVCAALDQIQSAAVTAVSGVADSSLVWTSNRTTTLQGDGESNVNILPTSVVAMPTPRLSEGEVISTDTPTTIPMATPQVLASSIVTTQSLAEAIATAIVVDALATPIVSSTNAAAGAQAAHTATVSANQSSALSMTTVTSPLTVTIPNTPNQPIPLITPSAPRVTGAMMTAMLDTDIPQSAEAMSMRHRMPSPAGDYTPITTIASSIDDSAAIDLSGLSRNRAVTSDDASRTVDISDVVVSMESVLSSNEADQSSILTTSLRSADESPMSTTPRPNDAETSAAGSTAPPGATQSSTVSTQALLAQGIHELVASAASTMSQLLSSTAVAMSSTNSTTVTTSLTTTSSANAGSEPSVPDGVDPSFLAALPDSIRQEVIAEQLRLQRIRQRAQQQQQQAQSLGITEVNPEFLAALPPSIQEEVLAQQRAEQARLAVQTDNDSADVPVDPAGFIQSLPPSLRQQVLADMDDSMVAVLPPELVAEANVLRHELEERHQRLMQERLFAQGAGPLSAILRQSGAGGRLGPTRYMIRPSHARGTQWGWGTSRIPTTSNANTVRLRGRHLLDHEALTCLMVLLFVDEPRMNTSRLHRVLRNLCYHGPTRTWIIQSLLSILHRTSECKLAEGASSCDGSDDKSVDRLKRKTSSNVGVESLKPSGSEMRSTAATLSWLSISLDAALGCRANVFQIHHRGSANPGGSGKKHSAGAANSYVAVHAQAAPVICRHVLDTLISLARSFPSYFLPQPKTKEVAAGGCAAEKAETDHKDKVPHSVKSTASGRPSSSSRQVVTSPPDTDFWDLLLRLDGMSGSKKGKYLLKAHSVGSGSIASETDSLQQSFETSPVGQLMNMLAHPVVRRSQLLTDRLLRLLGLVSIGLPDVAQQRQQHLVTSTVTGTVTTPAATATRMNAPIGVPSVTNAASTGLLGITTATTTVTNTQSNTTVTMSITGTVCSTTATVGDSSLLTGHQEAVTADSRRQGYEVDETQNIDADIDEYMTSTPLPKKTEPSRRTKSRQEASPPRAVLESQLQLAVQVLTSKSCSEEGLEDATNLLLQLSRANSATRDRVLSLLLNGTTQLGLTVCSHIRTLLQELELMAEKMKDTVKEEEPKEDGLGLMLQPKGVMPDRFHGGMVVVHASSKVKSGGRDLQLPSMSTLTSKTSSQHFFLRTLKAIIHLREAARAAAEKARKQDNREVTNVSQAMAEAMSYWEAESEAIIERLRRQDQGSASSIVAPPATTGVAMEMSGRELESIVSNAGSLTASDGAAQVTDDEEAGTERQETPMEMDNPGPSTLSETQSSAVVGAAAEKSQEHEWLLPPLSEQLQLDELWDVLSECLTQLSRTPDHHAVLVLQPTVEAFFLVHAGEKADKKKESHSQRGEDQLAHLNISDTAPLSPAPSGGETHAGILSRENSAASVSGATNVPPDTQKFLNFAEKHHVVLNQILRQSTAPLADGPFAVLVDHTRVLDFDVKRRYFRQELEHRDEGIRREDLAVPVRREHVFEDSYRELHRRSAEEWKHRFYIVFEGEEGQDAGGLLREWYLIMSREIFNPMYALFMTSPGDRVTYTINPSSHCNSNHLSYYKFVGRVMAKAIYDNKLLECYFTRSFYKHILGVPVKYTDMESEDYDFYRGLVFLLENTVNDLGYDLTFSTEIREFGVTEVRDIVPNGRNTKVVESRKKEYVKLVCQMKMTGAIRQQLNAFLEGFYDIIPKRLISIFNEQELELLISGLPTIDIDDLKANTEYHKYQGNSLQIQWFWRALRAFDEADRACLLQFVTGTSKVPLQGFAFLEGMTGIQKFQIHRDDRSTDRLPSAHTCFNQLDLPAYETYDKLKKMLLTAIHECSQGFGLA